MKRRECPFALLLLIFAVAAALSLACAARPAAAVQVKAIDALTVIYDADRVIATITPETDDVLGELVELAREDDPEPERFDTLYTSLDDLEALDVIRLTAPRNGRSSGQVVAWGEGAGALRASISPLVHEDGETVFGRENIQLRYLTDSGIDTVQDVSGQTHPDNHFFNRWYNLSYYDELQSEPPADADLAPIWVTALVPEDAVPGLYSATLTVGEHEIPVELRVSAWRFPDPDEYSVHNAHLLHSPETLSRHYGVPMWSDEHIGMMERSLHYLGLLGNRAPIITAQHRTHLGNDGAMIVFRADEEGGGSRPDFTVMNRYLDAYQRNAPVPEYITLYVWEPDARLAGRRRPPEPSVILTRIEDGEPVEWAAPLYDPAPDGGALGALLRGFREQIHERGWEETQMLIGMVHDRVAEERVVERFAELAPWAKWVRFSHYRGEPSPAVEQSEFSAPGYMPLAFTEEPYWPGRLGRGGWDMAFPRLTIQRRWMTEYTPLTQFRSVFDATVSGTPGRGYIGLCRWSMDHWNIEGERSLLLRFERSTWGLMYRPVSVKKLMAPGPDGPVATTRLEMLLEGLQETEARIALERALGREDLPHGLREDIESYLQRRNSFLTRDGRLGMGAGGGLHGTEIYTRLWGVAPDWPGEALRLFDLAAAVTQRTYEETEVRVFTSDYSGPAGEGLEGEVTVIVVGGGGGGGRGRAAGGGGGAVAVESVELQADDTIEIVVGRGGAGATSEGPAAAGGYSRFRGGGLDLRAEGGGPGGGQGGAGGPGGSEHPGGRGVSGGGWPYNAGGGGGGAGGPGGDAHERGTVSENRAVGGDGGSGVDLSSYVGVHFGVHGWFGGGGGGVGDGGGQGGEGRHGGGDGGAWGEGAVAPAGLESTGGGGGGAGFAADGGDGGSGIVIIVPK